MKITEIRIAECRLPLPRPIRLGPVEIRTRDFVAVRVYTDGGIMGDALGYPRGTALFESLKRMAVVVLEKTLLIDVRSFMIFSRIL